jgi:DNA-binding LacI/PurR family transcriptional regulator
VDGLILLGQPFKRDSIENNRWAGLPIVSVMWPEGSEGAISYVDIDWVQTYRQLIAHLRREGHDRIGFMTNGGAHSPIAYRLGRFREAMRLEGLSLAEVDVLDGGGRLEEASRRFAATLREGRPSYTAIVCGNDLMAAGCLEACRKSGLRVPDDMAIAGSEDILMSSHTAPPLTSLRYPRQEAGTLAVELLESLIAGDESVRELKPLQAELIVRASTMKQ